MTLRASPFNPSSIIDDGPNVIDHPPSITGHCSSVIDDSLSVTAHSPNIIDDGPIQIFVFEA